ncbi:MAG: exonuclease domain-containing protein [Bacteroidota bacterium]
MRRFAIIDIETTGSYSAATGITEIAVILHDGKQITDRFESLINPCSPVLPYVQRLTGISNEMLVDAPKFEEVAKKIWTMTEGATFVAHSVNFDYSFVRNAFKSLGADYRRDKLCTVRLSRKFFPGFPSYSLGNICSGLGIKLENRHRAMGDAEATAKLFQRCLEEDIEGTIVNPGKKNKDISVLPPLLPKETFDNLPEKPGVYYFRDLSSKIIYIGKAINIKSRIYSHFTGKGSRISFISQIADITYEICGTELIALLLESDEIKKHFPVYNQAQKYDRGSYVLTGYQDVKGFQHLAIARNHKVLHPLTSFRSFESAHQFLLRMISKFELCAKFCGLHSTPGACFDYQIKKCRGACCGKEDITVYNERAEAALQSISGSTETRMIIDEGREFNERSVVLIENGIYKGFGYFDASGPVTSPEEAREVIQPYRHTADVQRILGAFHHQE